MLWFGSGGSHRPSCSPRRVTLVNAPSTDADVRDRYPDALRAGALLVVVLGHWIATLPRLEDGRMVSTEHLLSVWDAAGMLTWVLQVVPLFVFVSAAVTSSGVGRRMDMGESQLRWWSARALAMARPTVTYMAVLAVMVVIAHFSGGRLLGPLDQSLTVHLWFLLMLLAVQALLPWSVRADRRFGLGAVGILLGAAILVDVVRASVTSLDELLELGTQVTSTGGGIGWLNYLAVWLIPQQLGVAWKQGRIGGTWMGAGFTTLGLAWLGGAVASGYPVAMVGGELDGSSNVLPPTLALVGVMFLQVGLVLLLETPARWLLRGRKIERTVVILGALGMPLYLWHKLAELPAAWLGEQLGAPIDAGVPGEAGFWSGRLWWVVLCAVMVAPVLIAVVAFETRRSRKVSSTPSLAATVVGGLALLVGLGCALAFGARPGALIGLVAVLFASQILRQRNEPEPSEPSVPSASSGPAESSGSSGTTGPTHTTGRTE